MNKSPNLEVDLTSEKKQCGVKEPCWGQLSAIRAQGPTLWVRGVKVTPGKWGQSHLQ